jgi:predicted nucleotide-binding protein (sugar kinase/HSP70/actin superfamily)
MSTETRERPTKLKVLNNGAQLEMEAELAKFEAEERSRLNLGNDDVQWEDLNPNAFSAKERSKTTLLVSGLTHAHDRFLQAGLGAAGFRVRALDCPDNDALRFGKEFGNRGQCNPTYFTVGNLIKFLTALRDDQGVPTPDIIRDYVFMTAGACGPCRFGMYVTEYRKALRDSGFAGFRVLLVSQSGGVMGADGDGLSMTKKDIIHIFRGIMMGDVLNAQMYRIRPFEVEPGATNAALEECQDVIVEAITHHNSLLKAAWRCRKILGRVQVDRSKVKPKVAIIGEFWAMTTEGDGNYRLQGFLEDEGAEVDIQPVTNWLLYLVSEKRWDTEKRAGLRNHDSKNRGLEAVDIRKKLMGLWAVDAFMRLQFQTYAKIMGLKQYSLANLKELGKISHKYYDMHLRGGESFLEVGKVISNVLHNKVNMTVSVKPFGCMPSSGVSDGVQSLVTELHPHAIFLAVETSGDAAINVYSRVQMQLFKAKQAALKEFDQSLEQYDMDKGEFEQYVANHADLRQSLHRSKHNAGCTAADLVHEVARRTKRAKLAS